MRCSICRLANAQIGVLCQPCRDALGPIAITQEQIQRRGPESGLAALVDVWGGVHRLSLRTTIGRTIEPKSLTILDPSVSRRHASIALSPSGWNVRDLGSRHGTFVDDSSAEQPIPIQTGNQLHLGAVRFYFIEDASEIAAPPSPEGQTQRPSKPLTSGEIGRSTRETAPIAVLPVVAVRLREPTGGGGGVIELDRKQIQLSLAQYEMIAVLIQRMIDQAHEPEHVRGCVSAAELASMLSLDSTNADDDNIRHIVQRLRRACSKAGIHDLIETKHGLGYRLRFTPRLR